LRAAVAGQVVTGHSMGNMTSARQVEVGRKITIGAGLLARSPRSLGCFLIFSALFCAAQPAAAQFTQQGNKLVGSNYSGMSAQGSAVALSADGNTAVIGGRGDSPSGAVWVFTRSGGVWTQQGMKLVGSTTASLGPQQGQGTSVAVSADGNTLIEGGPNDNNGAGAAWVFTRSNGVWTQQGLKLVGGAVNNASQGTSVGLSADGNTAVIGGPGDNGGLGAVYVFTRSNGVWTQQGSSLLGTGAVPGNGVIDDQGEAVAVSADGNTLIEGTFADNNGLGAVWIFTRSNGVWTQQGAKLVGSGASQNINDYQGYSVALSADGNTAIEGAIFDDNGTTTLTGAAWVFTRNTGVWTQQAKLVGTGITGTEAEQGWSVGLSGDGNTAIVGGPADDNMQLGAAWIFTRSNGVWAQQTQPTVKLVGTGNSGSPFEGVSVGLSADASTAIVGGYGDSAGIGAAWIFAQIAPSSLPVVTIVSPNNGPPAGGTSVTITGFNFTNVTGVSFGATAAAFTVNGDTSITATSPAGSGTIDITVTTSAGTSATSIDDQFTYSGAGGGGCPRTSTHDFNGDCNSDIAWRASNGDVGIWLMNGTQVLQEQDLGNVTPAWSIVGQRDFNGDGKADLLWRNSNGDVGIWLMNGLQILQTPDLGNVTTAWSIAGTGDLNGDGKGDVLWRNSNGDVGIWLMNGLQVLQAVDLGNVSIASGWSIAGTGDFNGDGKTDILWRNSNGDVGIWLMNGTQILQTVDLGNVPIAWGWSIAGTGDFNGDGNADVLWRDSNGDVGIWLMNGTQILQTLDLGNVAGSWFIAETGDFNGDGRADVAWRNTNGDVGIWFMNGTQILQAVDLGNVSLMWTIQGLGAD
jgi:hypothetical protein